MFPRRWTHVACMNIDVTSVNSFWPLSISAGVMTKFLSKKPVNLVLKIMFSVDRK